MKKEKCIVENSNGGYEKYWLAPWSGDPGRTLCIESAKVFLSEKSAQKAIDKVIAENPHRKFGNNFSIINLNKSSNE